MKHRFLIAASSLLLLATLLWAFRFEKNNQSTSFDLDAYKSQNMISCSPDWTQLSVWLENSDIPPMPGTGKHVWKISTQNDSAQFYFNQGINMYYGFHILEAMASFKKAKDFDPECAMLWWALALGYGPNINDLGYSASPDALEAVKMAVKYSSTASESEKALIEAMVERYSADSTISREQLNEQYTAGMLATYTRFADNTDIATLYADAMMLEHPWDLWNINGTPKSWTPLIRDVLEKILEQNPEHPGANHYYIHVMEPSPYFEKAIPSADRLGKLTPGLAHLVHMPSHIYLRTGKYDMGKKVNISAEKSFEIYKQLFPSVVENSFIYQWHNKHMQMNCAMMGGEKANSEKAAYELQQMIDTSMLSMEVPLGSYIQYLYYSNILSHVRFGNWNKLLQLQEPAKSHIYARVLYHFGKGMAHVNTNRLSQALEELQSIRELSGNKGLKIPLSPFSPAMDGVLIAENLLAGTISMEQNRYAAAIEHFQKAVTIEENMVYNEPRDWLLNPKPFLGYALLKSHKWDEARKAFTADLKNNNENGWSLYGLYRVAAERGQASEAKTLLKRYKKAFAKSDIKLNAPVF